MKKFSALSVVVLLLALVACGPESTDTAQPTASSADMVCSPPPSCQEAYACHWGGSTGPLAYYPFTSTSTQAAARSRCIAAVVSGSCYGFTVWTEDQACRHVGNYAPNGCSTCIKR